MAEGLATLFRALPARPREVTDARKLEQYAQARVSQKAASS
jgi:hypothetical protein